MAEPKASGTTLAIGLQPPGGSPAGPVFFTGSLLPAD